MIVGFRPAAMAPGSQLTLTRLTLCSDQMILTASAARRRGIVTEIVLRMAASMGYPCSPPPLPVGMYRSPFPTLFNPEGATEAGVFRSTDLVPDLKRSAEAAGAKVVDASTSAAAIRTLKDLILIPVTPEFSIAGATRIEGKY